VQLDIMTPFTWAEARAAGITARQLRGNEFQRLLGGVYISSRIRDLSRPRAKAALMVHPPSAVATHFSSARLRGAPVPVHPLEHVTVPRAEDRRQRHGVRCHVLALAEADIAVVSGLRISAPHRMFVELASALPLVDLVVVGDWLVRKGLITIDSLRQYCISTPAQHADAARRAAAYVRDRVDSPMETRLRMLIVLAGLPEPVVNLSIRDDHESVALRLDLSYPEVKVAVEYDGRQHVELTQQWERDLERRDELDRGRWRLVIVTSKGIYVEPERTVQRVFEALQDRGYRPLRRPTAGWHPHFGR
jgi:very-short-patch-repair endonuclease